MVKQKKGFSDPQLLNYKIAALVLCGILIFGFVAYLIQYLNLNIKHTVLIPAGAPGVLMSSRYNLRYWLIFLAVTEILVIFAGLAAMMFSGKNGFCSGLWFVIFILSIITFVIFFVLLGREGSNCNGADEADNICNHPLRCCDSSINGQLASGCPGPTICNETVPKFPDIVPPITIDKLGWSSDFVWLFWTTLILVVFDVAVLVIVYCVFTWEPSMVPDDPLGSSFTTTGSFAVDPGMPLTAEIVSSKREIGTSIASRVKVRKRTTFE